MALSRASRHDGFNMSAAACSIREQEMCRVASKHRMGGPFLTDGEVVAEVDFLAAGDKTSRTPPTPIVYLGEILRLCGIESDRRVRLMR